MKLYVPLSGDCDQSGLAGHSEFGHSPIGVPVVGSAYLGLAGPELVELSWWCTLTLDQAVWWSQSLLLRFGVLVNPLSRMWGQPDAPGRISPQPCTYGVILDSVTRLRFQRVV